MSDPALSRSRTAHSGCRKPFHVERMECRNGPSSLLDPLFALFDWGSPAVDEVFDTPFDNDTWQPVYVGSPSGSEGEFGPIVQQPGGGGGTPPITNLSPRIEGFSWTAEGGVYTFIGKVVDENPAGLTVKFGGLTSLAGKSTVTDANGNFSFTIGLTNSPNDRGAATAVTTDREGLSSAVVEATVL